MPDGIPLDAELGGLFPPPVPADATDVELVEIVDSGAAASHAETPTGVPLPEGGGLARVPARERALGLLYEAESKSLDVEVLLGQLPTEPDPFTVFLLRGVAAHASVIDDHLTRVSRRWDLDRMPALDRAILRIGTFELLETTDVPVAVVTNEAVELAKRFSTEDSSRFVNGVLSRLAKELR